MSKKIELDKYYTSDELAKHCVEKTREIIGDENITEYLEPSAGGGVFLKYLNKPYLAYDIVPDGDGIVKQDFLELDLDYKEGRCVIGNPPFGTNTLSVSFYKKSIHLGDYISFILPISQLHNNYNLFEFDLIHSENLGVQSYNGKNVHCCLNIYKKPLNGKFNKKITYKLKDVEIEEYRRENKNSYPRTTKGNFDYDIRICSYGASIGKEVKSEGQFAKEACIKVHNEKLKEEVVNLIKNVNWREVYFMTSTPSLPKWRIYKYIKDNIKDVQ